MVIKRVFFRDESVGTPTLISVGEVLPLSSRAIALDPAAAAAVPSDFASLYDEHVDYLWRKARALGVAATSVEDVLQEVFLVVHRRRNEFDGRSSMRTWITGILVRVVANHRRKQRRHEPLEEQELRSSSAEPLEAASNREATELACAILDRLDDDRRTVFVLAELGGLTANEIAEIVGVSPNTVSSRLRLARSDFERQLAQLRARDSWRSR